MKELRFWLTAVLLAAFLSACASAAKDEDELALGYDEINDPIEPFNRWVFDVNMLLDALIIRPIAEPYKELMPVFFQDMIRNLVRLADTPRNMANALLQGDVETMENITARFVINLTIGLGGLFDVAADTGYPYREEDFGQTLGVWGVEPGFYLVLPVFGPSSGRDAAGRVVDIFFDPMTYFRGVPEVQTASLAKAGAGGIDLRAQSIDTLDELQRDSVDFYARIRSLWHQNRKSEIRNGAVEELPVPVFSDDLLDGEGLDEDILDGEDLEENGLDKLSMKSDRNPLSEQTVAFNR